MLRTILILAASPQDTPPLRLEREVREIDNGLQRARRRDDFFLKSVLAARPLDVRRAMLDFKPNIVHFCGHGVGKDGIAFEDDVGNTKLVGSEALSGFFELFADKVECVVLNACYSETQAEAISRHISYVVGMSKDIGDEDAIEFAVAFYDAMGAGESIEFAYKLACNAIQWAGLPGYLTPVLKAKNTLNQLTQLTDIAAHTQVTAPLSRIGGIGSEVTLRDLFQLARGFGDLSGSGTARKWNQWDRIAGDMSQISDPVIDNTQRSLKFGHKR